jgi:hypothetical protein
VFLVFITLGPFLTQRWWHPFTTYHCIQLYTKHANIKIEHHYNIGGVDDIVNFSVGGHMGDIVDGHMSGGVDGHMSGSVDGGSMGGSVDGGSMGGGVDGHMSGSMD